jgi:hypothetical protein
VLSPFAINTTAPGLSEGNSFWRTPSIFDKASCENAPVDTRALVSKIMRLRILMAYKAFFTSRIS